MDRSGESPSHLLTFSPSHHPTNQLTVATGLIRQPRKEANSSQTARLCRE